MKYSVRTLHSDDEDFRDRFISPIEVEATSPREAAIRRYQMLGHAAADDTTALLVAVSGGDAWIFPVRKEPIAATPAIPKF